MKPFFVTIGATLIAQLAPPTADGLHSWLTSGVAVMGAVYLLILIYKALRTPDRHPPIDAELAKIREDLMLKISDVERHIDTRRSQGIGNLHEQLRELDRTGSSKLTTMAERIGRVEANSQIHTSQLAEHGRKLDLILMRLPRENPARD